MPTVAVSYVADVSGGRAGNGKLIVSEEPVAGLLIDLLALSEPPTRDAGDPGAHRRGRGAAR